MLVHLSFYGCFVCKRSYIVKNPNCREICKRNENPTSDNRRSLRRLFFGVVSPPHPVGLCCLCLVVTSLSHSVTDGAILGRAWRAASLFMMALAITFWAPVPLRVWMLASEKHTYVHTFWHKVPGSCQRPLGFHFSSPSVVSGARRPWRAPFRG